MNAHAKEWDKTSSEDKMGRDIADCAENNRFNVLNNGQPTYLSRSNGVTTAPDVTLAKNMRRATAEWRRLDHMGTDHIPINITVKFGSQAKVTEPDIIAGLHCWNWKKADWSKYQEDIIKSIEEARATSTDKEQSIKQAYKAIVDTILNSCRQSHSEEREATWKTLLE